FEPGSYPQGTSWGPATVQADPVSARHPPTPRHTPPTSLRDAPFRASAAIRAGLLTRGQLAGPAWRRLLPDIYLRVGATLDHFTWCEAVALMLPSGAAVAGRSAAYLWSADVLPLGDPPVEVMVPKATSLRAQPNLLVRRGSLAPEDTVRLGRILVTTPLRTAF